MKLGKSPKSTQAVPPRFTHTHTHTHKTMKTYDEKAESVLNRKNWTGLSLAELVDAGRISPGDHKVIWSFTTATLGDPADMAEWQEMRKVDKLVTEKLMSLEGGAK
jgi:hypothetical protein